MRQVLPSRRNCITQKLTILSTKGRSNYYITTDHAIKEIFISVEKTGSEHRALLDTIGQLLSVGLQHGVPLDTYIRLLSGSRFSPRGIVVGHPDIKFTSSPLDLVAKYLEWLQTNVRS